jgi:DNA polymerase-3 subunit alpha
MKVKSIKEIKINEELIDITLKGNPTFWVSKNGSDFVLTHNSDPPDVDLDLDSEIHKTTEAYLIEKYGKDKVCHIGNFLKFGAKTTVKDLSRIYKLDYGLTNKLTGLFSNSMTTTVTEELQQAIETAKEIGDKELVNFIQENYKYFAFGDKIVGMIRNSGRHASGILISDNKLNQSDIPILKTKGELVTAVQEGMEDREVSELGYMKLDILGLNTAGIVNNTFKLVESKYGIKNLEQTLLKSKFDDPEVWKQFAIGNSQDIFQFGGEGMIKLIKEIAPNNIYELTAINSLYRPANIEAKMIEEYIENRQDTSVARTKVNKMFPGLYELLEETYGAIVYQEQVIFVMQEVGGFSLAESDKARKILKKLYKKGSEAERNPEFDKLINKFKEGAIKKGVSEERAEELLQILSKYTGYTFNKCLGNDTEIITPKGKKNIKKIKVGDEVLSYDYDKNDVYISKVKKIHKNGKKKLYKIKTIDGKELPPCTIDHKFMIKNGTMKTLKEILDNDYEIALV